MDINSPKFNFFQNPFETSMKQELPASVEVDLKSKQNVFAKKISKNQSVSFKKGSRLNSYDTEILEPNYLISVEDEQDKTQFMIKKMEVELNKLEKKIADKKFFSDNDELQELFDKKKALQENIAYLKKRSSKKTIFQSMMASVVNFLGNENLPQIFSVFHQQSKLNQAVTKLNDVENNLYELLNSSVPHGETDMHYNNLAKEISKAGYINSGLKTPYKPF